MTDIHPFTLQDQDGTIYTVLIESKVPQSAVPDPVIPHSDDDGYENYGPIETAKAQLHNIQGTIRAYTWYVIGAFKDMAGLEVEEVNLKFGIKIGGKAGIPIFTEGTAESNFEVEVKCKFPKPQPPTTKP
jgi:Trypsin-co-occurring domain 1